jgi:hypothetical protein
MKDMPLIDTPLIDTSIDTPPFENQPAQPAAPIPLNAASARTILAVLAD